MSCTMNKRRSTKEKLNLMKAFFGRRCKFNRGNPNPGHKIWIFGMVERSTNRLIIYPVDRRICRFRCFCLPCTSLTPRDMFNLFTFTPCIYITLKELFLNHNLFVLWHIVFAAVHCTKKEKRFHIKITAKRWLHV